MDQTTQNPGQQTQQSEQKQNKGKNITMAVIAYIVFFVPLLTDAKDDPFVKYHVKQGLMLLIAGVAVWLIINVLPIIGLLIAPILDIAIIVLLVIGIMNAVNGVEKPLPFIGHYAENFKI
jgi:uncharacterized membrane protein